jgi:hypothetical protein
MALALVSPSGDYDVLQGFADDWSKEVAGEVRLAKLLYLICTSRLFDPMSPRSQSRFYAFSRRRT